MAKKRSSFKRTGAAWGKAPKPGKNDLKAGGASLKKVLPIGES